MKRQTNYSRPAFTLIELLVVMSIIAVIIALTVGTVLQVITGQQKKNTELTIQRLDGGLKEQIRAVYDQAKEQTPPASVIAIANGDMRRAKVIWAKLQVKRNFPMTYREALYPWAIDGNPPAGFLPAPPAPLGTGVASPIPPSDLPPLNEYVNQIAKVVAASPGSLAPAGTYSPDESSHLLFMIFSVTRRGSKLDLEQALGPGAIYQHANTEGGLRGIQDAWGQPIDFFRWPTDYPDNQGTVGDLQDPENTLMDANWNSQTQYAAKGGVYWFEQLSHLVHDPNAGTWTPRPFYAPPALVSPGRNGRLGFLRVTNGTPPMPVIPEVLLPAYSALTPNFGMAPAIDPTGPKDGYDNIINYSLK